MQVVVLAAGAGTRMHPLTLTRPKPLLPVAGRPLVHHVLDRAVAAGATRLDLIVHHGAGQVKNAVGQQHNGVAVHYHDQGEPLGTGHALSRLEPAPLEPFLLLSCDTLVPVEDLKRLASPELGPQLVVGAHEVDDPRAYGALETRDDELRAIHEKSDHPPSDLVNTGTYRLDPRIHKTARTLTRSRRGEFELTDAINEHATKHEVRILRLSSWLDVGRPWHLLDANQAVLEAHQDDPSFWTREGKIEKNVHITGDVRVERDAVVKAGSVIEGPVVIGAGARIGPLAYLRAGAVVGPHCHVGAHTEIKNSLLFEDANAPHLNYVGDSILGAGVNLGAGTVIANLRHDDQNVPVATTDEEKTDSGRRKFGAILADRVKTGVNVSLDCGTVIGPGALLAPGQAFRGHLEGDRVHYGQGKVGPRKR